VFISYSWAQAEIVRQIADRLKTKGFRIWIDVEQMSTYQFGLLFHGTGHIMSSVMARVLVCDYSVSASRLTTEGPTETNAPLAALHA